MIATGYIIKAHVVFTVLFMVYYAFFRKEKFLILNRFILTGIIAAAFILPVLRTFNIHSFFGINGLEPQVKEGYIFHKATASDQSPQHLIHSAEPAVQINYQTLAMITYISVAIVLSVIYLVNLYKIYASIRASHRYTTDGLTYCESQYETAPFSFFNFIVVSAKHFNPEEYRQIMAHESAHCRQMHSFDVLLADIACIVFWINPLIYLYRRQLKLNLEFLADEAALHSGIDLRSYQLNLLQHSGMLMAYQSANAFFTSKLKERIVMINTPQPHISNSYKYIMLLPLVFAVSVSVGLQKSEPVFIHKTNLLPERSTTENSNSAVTLQSASPGSRNRNMRVNYKPIIPVAKKQDQESLGVFVDARTDTVKFRLVPNHPDQKFKGIYVIDDKILSDDELRAAIKPTGKLEMILATRPVLGKYSANDSVAVAKWGEQARAGVVFVMPRHEKPNK